MKTLESVDQVMIKFKLRFSHPSSAPNYQYWQSYCVNAAVLGWDLPLSALLPQIPDICNFTVGLPSFMQYRKTSFNI